MLVSSRHCEHDVHFQNSLPLYRFNFERSFVVSMAISVGQPAPPFTLKSTKDATGPGDLGKEVSLSDYKGKWLIFFFYPLDFTFVCPTEILALSDRLDDFKRLGAEVLGCSCDSVYSHWAWISTPREKNGRPAPRGAVCSSSTRTGSWSTQSRRRTTSAAASTRRYVSFRPCKPARSVRPTGNPGRN
jgi:hypothetical protein